MSPFRSRAGFQRQRGPRRGMEWVSASRNVVETVGVGLVGASWIVLPSQARLYVNPTLVRLRGQATIRGAVTVATVSVGALGFISWKDRDDTVVLGEVPRPFVDPDLDWIWHSYYHMLTASQLVWSDGGSGQSIDSRAMRKLGADAGVLMVVEVAPQATEGITWMGGARCLIKE